MSFKCKHLYKDGFQKFIALQHCGVFLFVVSDLVQKLLLKYVLSYCNHLRDNNQAPYVKVTRRGVLKSSFLKEKNAVLKMMYQILKPFGEQIRLILFPLIYSICLMSVQVKILFPLSLKKEGCCLNQPRLLYCFLQSSTEHENKLNKQHVLFT